MQELAEQWKAFEDEYYHALSHRLPFRYKRTFSGLMRWYTDKKKGKS